MSILQSLRDVAAGTLAAGALALSTDAKAPSRSSGDSLQIVSGIRNIPVKRGTKEFLIAYSTMPILRMVVHKIADALSAAQWFLLFPTTDGPQKLHTHPLLTMLRAGNPYLTGVQARKAMALHYELVGESFWTFDTNLFGTPKTMWPLPPHWVTDTARPGRDYYEIQVPGGQRIKMPEENIIYFKDVDPFNPYARGSGTARALTDELLADEGAAKHLSAFLKNHARPDLIVHGKKGDTELDGPDRTRLETIWNEKFGGPTNSGKALFSSIELDVKEISHSFRDLQFNELRAFERDLIVSVYGIPPEIVGILQNSNRATIDAADLILSKYVVKPRLVEQRETMQAYLVPLYDERLVLGFEDPVPEDKIHNAAIMTNRPWAFRVDEHRHSAGLGGLPEGDGDRFPVNLGLRFPETLEEVGGSPAPFGAPPPLSARSIAVKTPTTAEIDAIIEALSTDALVDLTGPVIEEMIAAIGAGAIDTVTFGLAFDISSPAVTEFLSLYGADKVVLINDTTKIALRNALIEGLDEGETTRGLIRRVQSVMTDASTTRAERIVATETNTASNFATHEAHTQAGVEAKQWLATQDGQVRDTHMVLDKTTVPLDGVFISESGATAQYPGNFGVAEEDINCRCITLPVFEDGDARRDLYDTDEKRVIAWKVFEDRKQPWEQRLFEAFKMAFRDQEADLIRAIERASI